MQIPKQADLGSCDQEPIHIPGMIQPFGALLAMRLEDLEIVQASENLDQVMGMTAKDVLGRHLSDIIGEDPCRLLAAALERGEMHLVSPTVVRFPATERDCHVYYNSVEQTVIAEFELVQGEPEFLHEFNPKGELPFRAIHDCSSHDQLCRLLAREMRRLTEFDRAIVYRFDEDWHGVVIAEEKNHRYEESFLGHYFPASDIPVQARKLFTLNRFRVIPEVSYVPAALLPAANPVSGAPLDMTFCALRNVAPVHLEYLVNMGVKASLTVSLLSGGRLWGMITCHNATPRNIPFGVRLQCNALAELASYAIESIEHGDRARLQQSRQKELKKAQEVLAGSANFYEAINASAAHILMALNADAMILRLGEQTVELGTALPQAVTALIGSSLERKLTSNVAYSRNLGSLDSRLAAAAPLASGALYCKLNEGGDYFIALRRENVEARRWAGNPHKPIGLPSTGRLHPRKSFELWQEAVRGYSKRWEPTDVDVALELKRLLLERNEQLARKEFEDALRIERDRSSDVLEAMGEGFVLVDRSFRILRINSEGLRLTGRTADSVLPHSLWEVWQDTRESPSGQAYHRAMLQQSILFVEKEIDLDGRERIWLDIRMYPSAEGLAIFFRDVTEKKAMENALRHVNDSLEERVAARTGELERAHEQLRQSQKMEALGQLTGGIAHDFNNLLATIVASLDIMSIRLQQGRADDLRRYVTIASAATERAEALTHRLLSFARQQSLTAVPVDANKLVSGVKDLVQRAVGPSIRIDMLLARGLWPTICDPHQLENALLNLAINARDAMPEGGVLSIVTRNVRIGTAEDVKELGLAPGEYITMSASDTGIGMPPDIAARAFDPFFTTKPIGKGTGLGLSMIYGFVKQTGGQTRILSKQNEGTTVRLYLPRFTGQVSEETGSRLDITTLKPSREATVLVVEDEPDLRALLCEMLRELGYVVVDAQDADAALGVLQSSLHIDLLVSDVGLPGRLNGRKLAEMALEMRPALKALLITGFGDQAPVSSEALPGIIPCLTKPFVIEKFASRVIELLERGQ